ncbi:MAG TPA: cation ABC transporter substrate-binding protein [Firmicutes bacterium]|nr:cation ABC transporter substrate-binding protein [Bacillota bacterium]
MRPCQGKKGKAKNMIRKVFTAIAVLLLITACSGQKDLQKQKPVIFVSIPSQAYFLEKLAGERFQIEIMVRAGESPATYEPRPRQVQKLSEARFFFTVGVPFEEAWVPRLKSRFPSLSVVDTTAGIRKRAVETAHDIFPKDKKHEEGHGHGLKDPHVWLSPRLAKQMVKNIAEALIQDDPEKASSYKERRDTLLYELTLLQKEIRVILDEGEPQPFAVFHPSWGYFCDEFGLVQIPIEIAGREPAPREMTSLVALLRSKGVKSVIIQKEFSAHAAKAIAKALEADVILLEPLGRDYPELLREAARAVSKRGAP